MTHHSASNQNFSVPPVPVGQSTWGQDVPQGLKDEVQNIVWNIYGKKIPGLELESYRMCW